MVIKNLKKPLSVILRKMDEMEIFNKIVFFKFVKIRKFL